MSIAAQPGWAAEPTSTRAGPEITEVVVTARKVQESEQSVPITIAAFTPEEIQNKVVVNVRDLGQIVTGLVATSNSQGGAPTFAIRGTKTDNGVDGGVAVYFDDVPLISTVGLLNSFYDIASVEVLKGPQGTQFGTNTTGGTITVRAAKPTDKFEAFAEAGASNYNGWDLTGMVNVPVNDVLRLRLAANKAERDGFVKNPAHADGTPSRFSSDDHYSARFSVRVETDALTNDTVADYYHEDDLPRQNIPVVLTSNALGVGDVTLRGGRTGDRDTVFIGADPSGETRSYWNRHEIWGVQDVLNWEINDNFSVRNVAGYRSDDNNTSENNGGTQFAVINVWTRHENTEWVDDLTLRFNTDDKRFRTNLGAYYSRVTRTEDVVANAAQNLFLDFTGFPIDSNIHNAGKRWLNSRALYANADLDVTDDVTVSLGSRYNWDSGKLRFSYSQGFGVPDLSTNPLPTATVPCSPTAMASFPDYDPVSCIGYRRDKWRAPSYNLVVTNRLNERSLIYAKISTGYLAGGFNSTIREFPTFGPEKTRAFEMGVKIDWELASRPIRTNFDLFYGNSKDKQEVQNANYDDGGSAIGVLNAGAMTFYGLDFDAKYYLLDALQLDLAWTHVEAEYDNFHFPALGGPVATLSPAVDLTDSTPAQIPKDTLNLSLTYEWVLPSALGSLSTTMTGAYSSKVKFHDIDNSAAFGPEYDTSPSYWVSNFSTTWKDILGTNLDATLWVRNVFDKDYVVYKNPQATTFGYLVTTYGDPRTYGVRMRYNF